MTADLCTRGGDDAWAVRPDPDVRPNWFTERTLPVRAMVQGRVPSVDAHDQLDATVGSFQESSPCRKGAAERRSTGQ